MLTYKELKNRKEILEAYSKVPQVEKNGHAKHDINHINKVLEIIDKISGQLKLDKETAECARIAGLLHDIGYVDGKKNHTQKSVDFAKKYLKDEDLTQKQKNIIIEAIAKHSKGEDMNNIVENILYFADKLDYDKSRLNTVGYEIEGLNQIKYVNKIEIDIKEVLSINFVTQNEFDKNLLQNYYFTPKVFDAIKKFANFINKEYKVTVNKKPW